MNFSLLIKLILSVVLLFMFSCSNQIPYASGTSETTNGYIAGVAKNKDGNTAAFTQVMLIPAKYDPQKDMVAERIDTTTSLGAYSFTHVKDGEYNLLFLHLVQRTKAFTRGISVQNNALTMRDAVLQKTGTIQVSLPAGVDTVHGYVFIPGTNISRMLNGKDTVVVLDSVPADTMPLVCYSSTNALPVKVLKNDIPVLAGDTVILVNHDFAFAKKIILNTSATGANIFGMVKNFPVLVRLTNANFDFSQAKNAGQDIRFTKADSTSLAYEIEHWDSTSQQAEVWVKVDTIFGNNSTQYITMKWGAFADTIQSMSDGKTVFDTATGFQGVWHLSGSVSDTIKDATINQYYGILNGNKQAVATIGGIGTIRKFDGVSNYIVMPNTATSKLSFPANGSYSLSAWVYIDILDTSFQVVAAKGHGSYFLKLKGADHIWEFVEFHDGIGDNLTQHTFTNASGWHYLEGVRAGAKQYLYYDGAMVDSTISIFSDSLTHYSLSDFTIGKYQTDYTVAPSYFHGAIDEVRVSGVAHNADWIKLCYMNQQANNVLVKIE